MSDQTTVRVDEGNHSYKGTLYDEGETFEAEASVVDDFPRTLSVVDEVADEDDDEDEQQTLDTSADGFDMTEFVDRTPMSDVVDDIEAGAVDDRLDEVLEAEATGHNRDGVADAVAARRDELEAEE